MIAGNIKMILRLPGPSAFMKIILLEATAVGTMRKIDATIFMFIYQPILFGLSLVKPI